MYLQQIFFTKNVITKGKLYLLIGSKKQEDFLAHSLIFLETPDWGYIKGNSNSFLFSLKDNKTI